MKKYKGYVIIGSETKKVEIIADLYLTSNSCIIEFNVKINKEFIGATFQTVAMYPADKLVIESIEDMEKID
jgi:hypothetical protein